MKILKVEELLEIDASEEEDFLSDKEVMDDTLDDKQVLARSMAWPASNLKPRHIFEDWFFGTVCYYMSKKLV